MASIPSMSGMLMSISTMSGLSAIASSMARRPDSARPTTSMSLSKPSSLAEVVAGLGDVVDDEDADLVSHVVCSCAFVW